MTGSFSPTLAITRDAALVAFAGVSLRRGTDRDMVVTVDAPRIDGSQI